LLTLEGGGWTAALLPELGAAMARLAWRGQEVLVPLPAGADPNAVFAGAFVMAPWTNRLDGGRLPVGGLVHHLPVNRPADDTAIHGLARDRPFQVAERSDAAATLLQLLDGPDAQPPLPWRYALRMAVTLAEDGATIALGLTNRDAAPFPCGLGWHPFLARPRGTRLRFAATALLARDARCLPVAAQPSMGVDGDEAAYEGLDTAFAGWTGEAVIERPDGLRLVLSAEGAAARTLQVFAPAGETVLCVEPVSHVPDAPNRPALAPLGPLALLAPGATLATTIRLHASRG